MTKSCFFKVKTVGIEGIIELERDGQKLIKENGKIN